MSAAKITARLTVSFLITVLFTAFGPAAWSQPAQSAPQSAPAPVFSWQQQQATMLPTGNMQWAPRPFVFEKGASVRYIDFDHGDDAQDGATKQTPWKHHPWDPNAQANAKACKGIQTYIFKGGVIYRGALKGTDSGTPANPIRLTRDPAWGSGDALFYGSTPITGGWKKANAAEAPGIPNPDKVWYNDVGLNYDPDGRNPPSGDRDRGESTKFSAMFQVSGDNVDRLNIARDPNYDLSDPNNPMKNWHTWDNFKARGNDTRAGTITSSFLKGLGDRHLLDNAVIWTETSFLGAAVNKVVPKNYDPATGSVDINSGGGADYGRLPKAIVHFYIENVAKFLDSPGEYFFDLDGPKPGRLYLRPMNDVDPNTVVYEVAQIRFPLWIQDQHDIVISGLEFRYNDPDDGTYGFTYPRFIAASPCVRIVGNCANITVKNCNFYNVSNAVIAFPRPDDEKVDSAYDYENRYWRGAPLVYTKDIGPFANDVMDNIFITDNDVLHAERAGTIYVAGGTEGVKGASNGKLLHVEVLRNRVVDTGFRPDASGTANVPAISVISPETAEIAGNIVDTSWGNGIITFGGKNSPGFNNVPLIRILVHDNQIDNTMLALNDWGGLEHYQGGPTYIYNNITRNCVGNRTVGRELGYNLYLDGGFKCYCFNNIIAGNVKPDDPAYYSNCGYFMVWGFMDQLFNNTLYHFDRGIDGSSGNRSNILGNLMLDCKTIFIGQNRPGDVSMLSGGDTGAMGRMGIPTMAYASNVFFGHPTGDPGKNNAFGFVAGTSATSANGRAEILAGNTLEELRTKLAAQKCRLDTLGWQVPQMPLIDPANKDYRPKPHSGAQARGVKYFVPWALARNVGEWNFYKSAANPQVVLGESFYMTNEFSNRAMYYFVPRNDLTVSQCTPQDYIPGPLEDWIPGALSFNGRRTASLSQADMTRNVTFNLGGKKDKTETLDGSKRETLDMSSNNFLIEAIFKTEPGNTNGALASKSAAAGYELSVGPTGAPRLTLTAGAAKVTLTAATQVNDGQWHHLLAEVDRAANKATLYVDGQPAGQGPLDPLPKDASLANASDFTVGKNLSGAIDFLRVCRATLAESKTTIQELYAWEFNGPASSDFLGHKRPAKSDAGAIDSSQ